MEHLHKTPNPRSPTGGFAGVRNIFAARARDLSETTRLKAQTPETPHPHPRRYTSSGKAIVRSSGDRVRNMIFRSGGVTGATLLNQPRPMLQNRFLEWLFRASWASLVTVTLLVFLCTAALFAGAIYQSCRASSDDTYWRVLVIAFGGLGSMDIGELLDDSTGCIYAVSMISFVGLLLQSFVFSVSGIGPNYSASLCTATSISFFVVAVS